MSSTLDPDVADILGMLPAPDAPPEASGVTAEALGSILGVHPRTIGKLAADGLVVKHGRNAYDLEASVRAYCTHLRAQAAGRSSSAGLTEERTRLAREQADAVELKNAQRRRELVPAKEVESEWAAILRDVRAAMLAIPSRVQQRMGSLEPQDVAVMEREIRDALTEIADARD